MGGIFPEAERASCLLSTRDCTKDAEVFCTSWKHKSELCRMPRKNPCTDQDGAHVCGKDHQSSLNGSTSSNCKALSFKVKVSRKRCCGQGKRSKKGPAEEDARSMFALYGVPVSAPDG